MPQLDADPVYHSRMAIDPILQKAIDRGNALPIGTPQTGHIINCDEGGEVAANYLMPGTYGDGAEYTEPASEGAS